MRSYYKKLNSQTTSYSQNKYRKHPDQPEDLTGKVEQPEHGIQQLEELLKEKEQPEHMLQMGLQQNREHRQQLEELLSFERKKGKEGGRNQGPEIRLKKHKEHTG